MRISSLYFSFTLERKLQFRGIGGDGMYNDTARTQSLCVCVCELLHRLQTQNMCDKRTIASQKCLCIRARLQLQQNQ